jgi:signal transduction histidine kinase
MNPRSLLSLNSVRMRLTLWNVAVLALVLVVLGIVFSLMIQANVNTAVDRRLGQRARRAQRFFAKPPPVTLPVPPNDGEANAFGELRPRFFDLQAKPMLTRLPPWSLGSLTQALGGHEVFSTVPDGPSDVRLLSMPLRRSGQIIGVVQVGNSLAGIYEDWARMTRTLVTLIPLVLLVAGLGGAFLTDRALRPVRQIASAAGRIETENLSLRLPVFGHDEFADLADTFNGMLSRLQIGFERQEEAFEQQRRFTADASHELRTPLTIIKANTSLALTARRTEQEYQKTIRAVDSAADRMNRIVQDLLILARSDAHQLAYSLEPLSLADILAVASEAFSSMDHPPITLHLPSPPPWVLGHSDSLLRLFSNLLENAIRYTPSDGRITLSAEVCGGSVTIQVTDTGEGIAPEHLPYVTERFYRAEAARSRAHGGTGLGLSICRSILDAHSGGLAIESTVGTGTSVLVTLARAEAPFGEAAQNAAQYQESVSLPQP